MSKIICDICGTTYQDSADKCPICGCAHDAAATLLGNDLLEENTAEAPKAKSGRFSSRKKEIFDYDEVNAFIQDTETVEVSYDPDEDEYDEYEEEPRHNTFVVILLTVLIVALLAVAGFLFVRYFLPNMKSSEETVPPTTAAQLPTETTAAATQLEIPCQSLALTSGGTATLSQEGGYFLLHVIAMPEDTTDEIVFTSADESIATVTADGKITAVSEGETVIYITCGNSQLTCPVVCNFSGETEPETEPTIVATEVEEVPEGTDETVDATEAEEGAEETEAASTIAPGDVVLKLKKEDIGLKVYYYVTLELDCELEAADVEWSSEHPHIASVDENGVVTAKKDGVTDIIVKYGDQEVRCKVR